jgi:hypothetical protein
MIHPRSRLHLPYSWDRPLPSGELASFCAGKVNFLHPHLAYGRQQGSQITGASVFLEKHQVRLIIPQTIVLSKRIYPDNGESKGKWGGVSEALSLKGILVERNKKRQKIHYLSLYWSETRDYHHVESCRNANNRNKSSHFT